MTRRNKNTSKENMIENFFSDRRKALVIGGSNGIGLAVTKILSDNEIVTVIDRSPLAIDIPNVKYEKFDLLSEDYSIFDKYLEYDDLIITAGFGRLALFEDIIEKEIINQLTVNTIAPIRIIKHFYERLLSKEDFNCAVMVSIAGFMSSPFFSTYGASKAALKIFIESINTELTKSGTPNRILNVSPGTLKGTRFNNGENNLEDTLPIAKEIIVRMQNKEDLWIPQFNEIFKDVLERYHADFRKEGIHSYEYKKKSGRVL